MCILYGVTFTLLACLNELAYACKRTTVKLRLVSYLVRITNNSLFIFPPFKVYPAYAELYMIGLIILAPMN